MRGRNIAIAILKLAPEVEIIFTGNRESVAPLFMEFPYKPYLNSERVAALKPNAVVFDTLIPNWRVPRNTPIVYVMRRIRPETQHKILDNPAIARMDMVLIPHSKEEFTDELPFSIQQKAFWVGPIVRDTDLQTRMSLRQKYDIQESDFVITCTAGGGGKIEESSFFFGVVSKVHESLRDVLRNLRNFVVLGPYSRISVPRQKGMTILRFEPEMHNLIALSNLVIAEGGYNTVNETRRAKVPAVYIPSIRKLDNQEERVRALEEKGLCAVFTDRSLDVVADGILKIILSKTSLDRMKFNFEQDHFETGNLQAAKKILELVQKQEDPILQYSWK